jgi:hypothetical protein
VGHLLRYMDTLAGDETLLAALAEELTALEQKLPREVFAGDDPLDITSQAWLQQLVLSVRGDLADRLLKAEGKS